MCEPAPPRRKFGQISLSSVAMAGRLGETRAWLLVGLIFSGSLVLATWSFFLVQATFVLIPAQFMRRPATPLGATLAGAPDGFGRAYHAAEQALERLTTRVAG